MRFTISNICLYHAENSLKCRISSAANYVLIVVVNATGSLTVLLRVMEVEMYAPPLVLPQKNENNESIHVNKAVFVGSRGCSGGVGGITTGSRGIGGNDKIIFIDNKT